MPMSGKLRCWCVLLKAPKEAVDVVSCTYSTIRMETNIAVLCFIRTR